MDMGYLEAMTDILVQVQRMPATATRNDFIRLLLDVQATRELKGATR